MLNAFLLAFVFFFREVWTISRGSLCAKSTHEVVSFSFRFGPAALVSPPGALPVLAMEPGALLHGFRLGSVVEVRTTQLREREREI